MTTQQCKRLSLPKKRPCRICGRWFRPNPRVGDRQKVCSNPACQKKRRKKNQEDWRKRNPDYALEYRISQKANDELRSQDPPSVRPPLDKVPWGLAKDEIGTQPTEIIASLGRLLHRHAKDQLLSYRFETKREFSQQLEGGAKD